MMIVLPNTDVIRMSAIKFFGEFAKEDNMIEHEFALLLKFLDGAWSLHKKNRAMMVGVFERWCFFSNVVDGKHSLPGGC